MSACLGQTNPSVLGFGPPLGTRDIGRVRYTVPNISSECFRAPVSKKNLEGSTGHLIGPDPCLLSCCCLATIIDPEPIHRLHFVVVFIYLVDTESHWENCQTMDDLHL